VHFRSISLSVAIFLTLLMHGVLAWWLWQLKTAEPIKPVELMSMEWVEDKPDVVAPPKVEIAPPAPVEPVDEPEPVLTQQVAPPPPPPIPKEKPKPQPKPTPTKVPVAQAAPTAEVKTESVAPPSPVAALAPPASVPVEQKPLVRAEADYLNNPKPSYPRLSKRMGEQGEVRLRVLVAADGRVTSVELSRSSGYERLDEAALESVKQWRFKPATQGGEPLEAWVEVPVKFVLENE
jgi:periplasmic protein TonB